jgi:hypothetical protein
MRGRKGWGGERGGRRGEAKAAVSAVRAGPASLSHAVAPASPRTQHPIGPATPPGRALMSPIAHPQGWGRRQGAPAGSRRHAFVRSARARRPQDDAGVCPALSPPRSTASPPNMGTHQGHRKVLARHGHGAGCGVGGVFRERRWGGGVERVVFFAARLATTSAGCASTHTRCVCRGAWRGTRAHTRTLTEEGKGRRGKGERGRAWLGTTREE